MGRDLVRDLRTDTEEGRVLAPEVTGVRVAGKAVVWSVTA